MSARITLHCDRVGRETACAVQLVTDAATVAEARAIAADRGWHYSAYGRQDVCPQHASGRPGPYAEVAQTGGRSAR